MERGTGHGEALHVASLSLFDYRRFKEFEFRPSRFNVIVGVNGSGKSALLQSLAVGLSRLTYGILTGRAGGVKISALDIRLGEDQTSIVVELQSGTGKYARRVRYMRNGRKVSGKTPKVDSEGSSTEEEGAFERMSSLADVYREKLAEDQKASLPVIAKYSVNRVVVDVPIEAENEPSFDQTEAYRSAFDTPRNFPKFFQWFRAREDLENEERLDYPRRRDPQLQAVRRAIESFMDGYSDLRVRRDPLRLTLRKGAEELVVDQLSDGEKALLSLVGDLARRMAIANPGLKNPLEGEGVVMIDEVDLHLHPSWQRKVVQRLPETFPNVQFFLTTHSPVVASAVRPEHLWVLRDGEIKHAEAYGQDVGLVLSEVFGTAPRLDVVRHDLDALFEAIHRQDFPDAQRRLESLEKTIGPSDPELVQARVMMQGYAVA